MSSFDGGAAVAAWELDAHDRLLLFRVSDGGARPIDELRVAPDKREEVVEELLARSVRIGATYAGKTFVWVADPSGYAVWNDRACLSMTNERPVGVKAVRVFYDVADRGRRGVSFELESGEQRVIVRENDPAARLDVTYGEQNLRDDTQWARHLGEHLAVWLLVELVDEVRGTGIADDLRIARVAGELADAALRAPESGPCEQLIHVVGPIGRSAEVALRLAQNPLEPAKRFLELRVQSPTGKTTSGRWIKQGSNAQIAAFLRRVTTPATVLFAMNDLLRDQRRDGYM